MAILTNQTPPGTIISGAGPNPPAGYMLCDGSAISRAFYANLFNAINVAWGYGDNASTFNIPDLRGMFIRGVDSGRGIDPESAGRYQPYSGGNSGDNVGSYQQTSVVSHSHHYGGWVNSDGSWSGGAAVYGGTVNPTQQGTRDTFSLAGGQTSTENRPINAYVNYYIKY